MLLAVIPNSFDLRATQDEAWPSTVNSWPQICSLDTADCLEFSRLLFRGEFGRSRRLHYHFLQSPCSPVVYCSASDIVRCSVSRLFIH